MITTSKLTGVSETLLIPLAVRYYDNLSEEPLLPDPAVKAMVELLNADPSKFPPTAPDFIGVAARGHILDDAVNHFIADHPDATILNLGAGLCTRYERLTEKPKQWIDVDLPQVEPAWRIAFGPDGKRQFIAASVTDLGLWEELQTRVNGPLMVIAEGLMMYIPESGVHQVFGEIASRFPGAEMLVEVMSPFFAKNTARHPSVSKTTAEFVWGIKDVKELENIGLGIKVLGEKYVMDWKPSNGQKLPKTGLFFRVASLLPMLRKAFRVAHLRIDARAE